MNWLLKWMMKWQENVKQTECYPVMAGTVMHLARKKDKQIPLGKLLFQGFLLQNCRPRLFPEGDQGGELSCVLYNVALRSTSQYKRQLVHHTLQIAYRLSFSITLYIKTEKYC